MMRIFFITTMLCFFLCSCGGDDKAKTQTATPVSSREKTMDSIATEMKTARELLDKGKTDEAIRMADAMIKKYPGQLDALSIKADALKAKGKTDDALTLLEKAYALQPRDKETAYNLAYEYAEAKSAKALSLTDTLIKYDKTETVARAWYIKGTYYNNLGNEKEALRYYDSSLIADYNFSDSYFDKGQILFKQKRLDDALKAFALGQKMDPKNAYFYLWVAKTQEAMGDKANAKQNYETAYALDHELTEAKDAAERLVN